MTFASILSLLKFLPTLLDLATKMEAMIAAGVDLMQIKAALKEIDAAFIQKSAIERAKRLNDVFRKP